MHRHVVFAPADGPRSADDASTIRSISLISPSGTSHPASIALVVPRPVAKKEQAPFPLHHQAVIPNALGLEIILLVTLSFLMGSLVKARLSPS